MDKVQADQLSTTTWRKDIQGLRAIAVLAVVLYHGQFDSWSGGYVGVDIFFVISGYLITGLMLRELQRTGRIDVTDFYLRRVRRLAPALAVMICVSAVLCFLIYPPLQQRGMAASAVYAASYISNLFFSFQYTDYLAADPSRNPFLHTWTLGVEEQFYLAWPFVTFIAFQLCKGRHARMLLVLAGVALLSFAACWLLTATGRSYRSFFLLPFRAWEFMAGSVVALVSASLSDRMLAGRWRRPLATLAGLLLIGFSLFFISDATAYPGLATLAPVLGTALLILVGASPGAGQAAPVLSRLLSMPVLQRIGAVSYSWYLWHWPVIVLGFALWPDASRPAILLWLAVSYLAAELSYVFVERRFSSKGPGLRTGTRALFKVALVPVGATLLCVSWVYASAQFSRSPDQRRFLDASRDIPALYDRVDASGADCAVPLTQSGLSHCADRFGNDLKVALLGDSHAAQWTPALVRIAKDQSWNLNYFAKLSCSGLPLPANYDSNLRRRFSECAEWTDNAYRALRRLKPDLVIYSVKINAEDYSARQWVRGLDGLVQQLPASTDILVIGDNPRASENIPECLSIAAWQQNFLPWRRGDNCAFAYQDSFRSRVLQAWRQRSDDAPRVHLLDSDAMICDGRPLCSPIYANNRVKYRDSQHLTATYVRTITGSLFREITQTMPSALLTQRAP